MTQDALDEKTQPLPPRPRLRLNGKELLPYRDVGGQLYNGDDALPHTWILPGRQVISTEKATEIARHTPGGTCEIVLV